MGKTCREFWIKKETSKWCSSIFDTFLSRQDDDEEEEDEEEEDPVVVAAAVAVGPRNV